MILSLPHEGNGELHLKVLKSICGNTEGKKALDICCGYAPQTRHLGFSHITYVDKVERDLGSENKSFIVENVFDFFKHNRTIYDTSIILDGIEHFRKPDAHELIHQMELFSDKQIIFTPLGDHMIEHVESDDPDTHKSGWLPADFGGWASVIFPNFHKLLGIGAFFTWYCPGIGEDFSRVVNELKEIL